jgi:PAS domain S-box-containing protein
MDSENIDPMYESEYLKKVMANIPIGLCYVHERTFLWVNEFILKMLGYTYEELVNHSTRILYKTDTEFNRVGELLYTKKTGVVSDILRKDGQVVTVMMHAISEEKRTPDGKFLSPHVVTISMMSPELLSMIGTAVPMIKIR